MGAEETAEARTERGDDRALTNTPGWPNNSFGLFHSISRKAPKDSSTSPMYTDIIGGFPGGSDGNCSLEIKRCLLLGRKVITNLDSILKSRDITLPTKVHKVKSMVFQ